MKKTLSITAALLITALAAPLRADVTPQDVREGAHEKGQTIKKNAHQAGEKTESGAKRAENAGNRGAYKLRAKKDQAKADWEHSRSEEGGSGKTGNGTTESSRRHLNVPDDASGDTSAK